MKRFFPLVTAMFLGLPSPVVAQNEGSPSGHMIVRYIKTKPGKSDEYRQFLTDTTGRAMQIRADEGNVDGWVFARTVLPPASDTPAGSSSTSDYLLVNVHQGVPPERVPIDPYFVKAGVNITRQEWYARLGKQTRFLRMETWRNVVNDIGRIEKGHYLQVDYLKVPDDRLADWRALARETWRRIQQARIDDGELSAWQAQSLTASDPPISGYNVRIVTAYPDLASIARPPKYHERLAQLDSNKDSLELFARVAEMQDIAKSDLFEVIEVVRPVRAAEAGD